MKNSILKFFGTGACLNPKLGNNSAYHYDKENKRLLLIDCGESIFERIHETNIYWEAQEIIILITHMHTDHVGSLPSLIFSCKYEKNIVPTIIFPSTYIMKQFLAITSVPKELYKLMKPENCTEYTIYAIQQQHLPNIIAYGYIIFIDTIKIFYSGDSKTINSSILSDFLKGDFEYFYQDVSIFETPAHMNVNELANLIPEEKRKHIICMHFDNETTIQKAKELGFNVAIIEKE